MMTENSYTAKAFDGLALDVMANWHEPITPTLLHVMLRNELTAAEITMGDILSSLQRLRDAGLAHRSIKTSQPPGGQPIEYEVWEPTAASVTMCNAREPEPSQPATALLCVDEDELDDWWAEQNVEVKADAFMRFAMDRQSSYIYGEDNRRVVSVPIAGVANCTAEFDARLRARVAEPGSRVIDNIDRVVRAVEERVAISQADGAAAVL